MKDRPPAPQFASAANAPMRLLEAWRHASWLKFLLLMFAVYFLGNVAALALPPWLSSKSVHQVKNLVLLVLFITRLVLEVPAAVQRRRDAAARGASWLDRSLVLIPQELRACLKLDRAMWRGFIAWIRRRPALPPPAEGERIEFLKRSSYSTVFALAVIVIFTEVPMSALMVSLVEPDSSRRLVIHFILIGLVAYSMIWMLGDRWLLRHSAYVVTNEALRLQVSARTQVRIPLADIEDMQPVSSPRAKWCAAEGVDLARTVAVTPWDRPNLVIKLRPGHAADLHCMQSPRHESTHVFVYADHPSAAIQLLRSRMSETGTGTTSTS